MPWTNKKLTVAWEHFVSKLEPGQKETWTAVITGPDAKKAVAEMVAALYDQSLDAYLPHDWPPGFGVFRQDYSNLQLQFENMLKQLQHLQGNWPMDAEGRADDLPLLPGRDHGQPLGIHVLRSARAAAARRDAGRAPGAPMAQRQLAERSQRRRRDGDGRRAERGRRGDQGRADESRRDGMRRPGGRQAGGRRSRRRGRRGPDLSQVAARKNLNETAFFFPHLVSDKEGQVKMEFTMPEALTAVEVPRLRPRPRPARAACWRTRWSRPRT